uniref:NADH-ubiquinone oxidoreductase chain 6 n=1 Tax=Deronectes costipennis TaxID=158748 RepID=A0A894K0B9_9DYTI|nr:NADH dehydrogenase subunit 6 [Deronectes costipennis]
MFLTIMILNLYLSIIFLFLNHPMSMGLILMTQTICITLMTGFLSYSMWFSYILFLIMIGGMLILFMYMTSLASNEKFKFSSKIFIMIMIMIFMILFMIMLMDFSMINSMFKTSNSIEMINKLITLKNENSYSMYLMYNKPNFMITITMINYLFLTLIAVVKITKFNYGPLRQKF